MLGPRSENDTERHRTEKLGIVNYIRDKRDTAFASRSCAIKPWYITSNKLPTRSFESSTCGLSSAFGFGVAMPFLSRFFYLFP